MNKFAITLAVLLATFICVNAQIPNSGFESWSAFGNGLRPDGWWSTNDSVGPSMSYFPVTRSTDHYPQNIGDYSIRIQNNTSLLPGWGSAGLAWTGGWDGNNLPAFPVTGHPVSLCGYYRFFPENGDSARIFICLYNNGVEVAQASLMNNVPANAWTAFTINFPSYADADSARIMLSAFNADNFIIHGNSVLYVDNLSFDNHVGVGPLPGPATPAVRLFPVPASDILTLEIGKDCRGPLTMDILDITGKTVLTAPPGPGRHQVEVSSLEAGLYFVRITSGDWHFRQKLVIRR